MFDADLGREAVKSFHNASTAYSAYRISFDELLLTVAKNQKVFLEGLGSTIRMLEMDESDVDAAMEVLAEKSQGRVPAQTVFFQALSDEKQNYSFVEAVKFTTVESAKDLATGTQKLGDTVITTLKGLGFVLPFLVVGGLIFYVYRKVQRA